MYTASSPGSSAMLVLDAHNPQLQTVLRHQKLRHLQERLVKVVRRQGLCAASAAFAAQGRVRALVEAVLILPSPAAAALLLGCWRVPAGSCSMLGTRLQLWTGSRTGACDGFLRPQQQGQLALDASVGHSCDARRGSAIYYSPMGHCGRSWMPGTCRRLSPPTQPPRVRVRVISLPSIPKTGDCRMPHQAVRRPYAAQRTQSTDAGPCYWASSLRSSGPHQWPAAF